MLDTLTYYAGLSDRINGQVIPARTDALTYTVRASLIVNSVSRISQYPP